MAEADRFTPMSRTSDCEDTRGVVRHIGELFIQTPRGPVALDEVQGAMTVLIEPVDGVQPTIGLMLYQPSERALQGEAGVGMFHQLGPDNARAFAASLLRLADQLDGGATKQ